MRIVNSPLAAVLLTLGSSSMLVTPSMDVVGRAAQPDSEGAPSLQSRVKVCNPSPQRSPGHRLMQRQTSHRTARNPVANKACVYPVGSRGGSRLQDRCCSGLTNPLRGNIQPFVRLDPLRGSCQLQQFRSSNVMAPCCDGRLRRARPANRELRLSIISGR